MSRPLIPIDASWRRRELEPDKDYLFRGYVIRVDPEGGYKVLDPQREDDEYEDGWAVTLFDTMAVVNELVDGEPRRKSL